MPRFEAASISIRSRNRPSRIATQVSQRSQGSPSLAFGQFTAFAISRAIEVLPVPRTPARRDAAPTWPVALGGDSLGVVRAVGSGALRHCWMVLGRWSCTLRRSRLLEHAHAHWLR